MSYSEPVELKISEDELLKKIHTLPNHPSWIPYRTSYFKKDWGFCCTQNLIKSKKFLGPFKVKIESRLDKKGELNWLECVKSGKVKDEILISSYCCHPSLANDNLSGLIASILLFEYLLSIKTKYSYRLVIAPETIGAISFLSQANTKQIIGGMILTCVAGPGKHSIKEAFDNQHWINKAAHNALKKSVGENYITYPFIPDGSDERQYSTPGFRIATPSIHKSKYYTYPEYHTSADNLSFISISSLNQTLEIYKQWIDNIESYHEKDYLKINNEFNFDRNQKKHLKVPNKQMKKSGSNLCYPKMLNQFCELQLGKRGLYPDIGGTLNQTAHHENKLGNQKRTFDFDKDIVLTGAHIDAFHWLMHLADGKNSNHEIAKKSGLSLQIINESISALFEKKLVLIK
jgi:aminopeptidase-like protein